jgi:hypothetical protein
VVATGDIDIIAPGLAADSLETLEEIAIRYASLYRPMAAASCATFRH